VGWLTVELALATLELALATLLGKVFAEWNVTTLPPHAFGFPFGGVDLALGSFHFLVCDGVRTAPPA
jgi:hypothetical protein